MNLVFFGKFDIFVLSKTLFECICNLKEINVLKQKKLKDKGASYISPRPTLFLILSQGSLKQKGQCYAACFPYLKTDDSSYGETVMVKISMLYMLHKYQYKSQTNAEMLHRNEKIQSFLRNGHFSVAIVMSMY